MNLHLMSPIGFTGYGYTALNILKSLSADHNIGLTPIGNPSLESQDDAAIVQHSINLTNLIPYDASCLKIWHQFDLLTRVGRGKYYAFPFFEVDKFNQKELHSLEFVDELIVSSKWAADILRHNSIDKPISTVKLGVDTKIFDHTKYNNKTSNYVFITIGKWEKRKGHDVLIDCFNKAFTPNDNVELWMVTHNPFLNQAEEQEWISHIENSPLKNKIRLFPRVPTHQGLAELISYANCGVYLSKAEGWNLELLETMAMNKPVITTNYSAHTEYCNNANSFLIDINETELAIDNKWFFGTSSWAKIGPNQIEQIINHLKYCYNNYVNENNEGLNTANELTWSNTAGQLLNILN